MSTSRETILERVRSNLERARSERGHVAPPAAHVPRPVPAELGTSAGRLERFRSMLEGVGGRCHLVADEAAALAQLVEIARGLGVTRLALSDAPRLARLARALPSGIERLEPQVPREALFAAELGVSEAQWGIAETGTLVLESARERHRLVSLVPPVHVALLPASSILATLEEALERLRSGAGLSSPAVTWITGPSRTADIELVLVVGVHGPRELHVIVIDGA